MYFVGTSDTLSVQMTCLSAYIYRQNSEKALLGGGGGLSGYANGWQCQGSWYNDLGNLRAKRAANLKILVCLVVFLCWIKRFVLLSLCLNVNIWIDILQAFKNRGGDDPPQKNSRGGHVPPVPPPGSPPMLMRHFLWTIIFVICPISRVSKHDDK